MFTIFLLQDELGLLFPTLFLTSTIVPCLAGWAFMVLFGLEGLSKIKDWWEPTNAFFMVCFENK